MDDKKQLMVNAAATITSYVVQLGVSFVLTPYIVRSLGATAYGFIPLISNLISYTGILTTALNSMASRFISLEFNKGDIERANVYFKSVLVANSILAVVLAVPAGVFSFFPTAIMNVPETLVPDVRMAFLFSAVSMEVSLVLSVFGCVYYVKNRLDKSALRNIEGNVVRAVVLLILFTILSPRIYYVPATMLIVNVYVCAANIYYTRRLTPQLSLKGSRFSGKAIRELLSSGIWNSVDQLSWILLSTLGIYLANLFAGPDVGGLYSISKTVPGFLGAIASLAVSVFAPPIMIDYAKGRFDLMKSDFMFSIKSTGVVFVVPIGFFLVFGGAFFDVWMPGQDSGFLQSMAVGILIPMIASFGSMLANNLFIAANKLKVPALIFLISGVLNVGLVIVLEYTTGLGIWAIILVQAVIDVVKNAVVIPWYVSWKFDIGGTELFRTLWRTYFSVVPTIAVCVAYKHVVVVGSWPSLFLAAVVCGVISLALSMLIVFNRDECRRFRDVIMRRRH